MISSADRENIYQSQQRDSWEFKKDASGYFWIRTAANKEVVGTSHRAFTRLDDCEQNAKILGYQNSFTVPRGVTWEFYQDNKKEHRWRLLDEKGVVLGRAHEGYSAATGAEKNAVRHGYGLVSTVESLATAPGWPEVPSEPCVTVPTWAKYAIGLLFLVLIGAAWAGTSAPSTPANTTTASGTLVPTDSVATFLDVPLSMSQAECIYSLAERDILTGYKQPDGTPTGQYGYYDELSKNQLAKVALSATETGLFSCAPTAAEPTGETWSMPYIRCAVAKAWRVYPSVDASYEAMATKAEAVVTLLDAFELNEADAAQAGLFKSLGEFTPQDPISRGQLAELVCSFEESAL